MLILTPEQVVSRWNDADSEPETDDVALRVLIEDVLALAEYKFPTLEKRVDNNQISLRVVQLTLCTVVKRAYLTNSNGLSSYSYSSGPFSESGTYGNNVNKNGTIWFTQEEISLLGAQDVSGGFKINLDIHQSTVTDLPYANYEPYSYVPGEV